MGHVISQGQLRMDEAKLRAIKEWKTPIMVTEPRSFLGLANYYRRFISGYSAKVTPSIELLKNNKPWVWSEQCKKTFEDLKVVVTKEPILVLPDFYKTFEVHTDASDFAIGGILMQDRHPIVFESRKLTIQNGGTGSSGDDDYHALLMHIEALFTWCQVLGQD